MPIDKISMRQLMVLLFAALLSPAIGALPIQSAAIAGRAGWLSTVAALPVLLALCWLLFALFRRQPEGAGLAEVFQATLGTVAGKLLTTVYLLWGILLLGVNARRFALRFLSTSYRNTSLVLFVAVLLGFALWMGWGKLGALARAGEVFYLALSIALGVVIFFALFHVEAKHVFPIWIEDLPASAVSALPALSVLGYVIFGAFLAGGVNRREKNRRKAVQWAAAFCAVLTALQFVCLGNFGPALLSRMDAPFFMMVKGIGVEGAFERVESVIVALWVLSDLALLGLILFACRTMAQSLFSLKEGRTAAIPVALLALVIALFLFPDAFTLSAFMDTVLEVTNLALGFLVPAVIFLIGKFRKQV